MKVKCHALSVREDSLGKAGRIRFWRVRVGALNTVNVLALTEFRRKSSVSSFLRLCTNNRFFVKLTECGAELIESFFSETVLSKKVPPVLQESSVASLTVITA